MQYVFLFVWFLIVLITPFINVEFDFITLMQIEIAFLCLTFWLADYNKNYTLRRSLTTIAVVYYTYIAMTDWAISYLPIWLHITEIGVFTMAFLYQLCKKTEYTSDNYNKDYVYLIFFKPKSFLNWVYSLFGSPVASMGSIITKDNKTYVYRLKHGKSKICRVQADMFKIKQQYIILNTGVRCDKIPNKTIKQLLEQSAYSKKRLFTRTNCVDSQKPLIDRLGKKWYPKNILEFIPSIYLKQLYKRLGR